MKITIGVDGEIHMDTNGSTPAEIAGTILSIQREQRRDAEADRVAAAMDESRMSTPLELNTLNAEMWDWLVDNDIKEGVHIHAMAREFSITKEAATQRCAKLVSEGHAVRVSVGRYRAVTG